MKAAKKHIARVEFWAGKFSIVCNQSDMIISQKRSIFDAAAIAIKNGWTIEI